jgi:IS30 family transposase
MAKHLAAHSELEVSEELLHKLECISISTVRRRLHKFARLQHWQLPRRQGPRQFNPLTRDIPMKRIPWDEQVPGHFEIDLVHHCGRSSSGQYVHTVQMIDVATGWSERAAVLGRSQLVMEDACLRFVARLPFKVLELHPDNGSEFFNHHLLRLWKDIVKGVKISRSRPFHKNDNRFVEQKNATLVRAYLGDARFDTVGQTRLLNRLYDKMWLPKVQLLPARLAHDRQDRALRPWPGLPRATSLWPGADTFPTPLRNRRPLRCSPPAAGRLARPDQPTTPAA